MSNGGPYSTYIRELVRQRWVTGHSASLGSLPVRDRKWLISLAEHLVQARSLPGIPSCRAIDCSSVIFPTGSALGTARCVLLPAAHADKISSYRHRRPHLIDAWPPVDPRSSLVLVEWMLRVESWVRRPACRWDQNLEQVPNQYSRLRPIWRAQLQLSSHCVASWSSLLSGRGRQSVLWAAQHVSHHLSYNSK